MSEQKIYSAKELTPTPSEYLRDRSKKSTIFVRTRRNEYTPKKTNTKQSKELKETKGIEGISDLDFYGITRGSQFR